MRLYSENENYKLYQGSMLDMLDVIPEESVDSIITDPPYELNFMGKGWDNAGVSFQKETWEKCFKALKSGGYLLAFGGSRTFHRIACAIEDAGFEIRDTIMWLYGSGFPKSMNIGLAIDKKNGVDNRTGNIKTDGKATNSGSNCYNCNNGKDNSMKPEYEERIATNKWRGWGTCLKPSFEPIIVARKPFKGSLVDNIIENGVGGINIDECRVETTIEDCKKTNRLNVKNKKYNTGMFNSGVGSDITNGRFPANTILTYDETDFDEVCGGFPNTKSQKTKNDNRQNKGNSMFIDGIHNENNSYEDSGSASRYFYCAKASKKDRDEGLDELVDTIDAPFQERLLAQCKICGNKGLKSGTSGKQLTCGHNEIEYVKTMYKPRGNTHPTVKPTELMQYLVRLVSPNGATILDPFNGSGSTGKAVMYENYERNKDYKYIGIELTEEYLPISKARIEYVCNLEPEINPQMSIFDLEEVK